MNTTRVVTFLIFVIAQMGAVTQGWSGPVAGRLYYTRSTTPSSVNWVDFTYDGRGGFTLTNETLITTLARADGLVIAPDGDLLVGGGCENENLIYKVNPYTGKFVSRIANGGSCHMSLDPNRTRAWAGFDYSGSHLLAEIPLNPFSSGIGHSITGSNSGVGTLAWDTAGNAFYTTSWGGATGAFGAIDLNTFVTSSLLTNLPAAHGMAFDQIGTA